MQPHWERVSGRLGANPEEAWGRNDEPFVRFSLCCDSYEDGKVWYTMLGKHELVRWILDRLSKGDRLTCEGEVSQKPYTDKQGRARLERVMRLKRVEMPGGVSCEATNPAQELSDPEEAERVYWEKRADDLAAYPLRWERAGFFDSAGGKKALRESPALWQADECAHDPMEDVPSEVLSQFIRELAQELTA